MNPYWAQVAQDKECNLDITKTGPENLIIRSLKSQVQLTIIYRLLELNSKTQYMFYLYLLRKEFGTYLAIRYEYRIFLGYLCRKTF